MNARTSSGRYLTRAPNFIKGHPVPIKRSRRMLATLRPVTRAYSNSSNSGSISELATLFLERFFTVGCASYVVGYGGQYAIVNIPNDRYSKVSRFWILH